MKTTIAVLTLSTLLVAVNAQAACRAVEAAKLGSEAGLARDNAAAVQAAEQERSNSDILGKCITGVTSIQVMPTFPSLMDIFNQAATRMCRLANNAIPRPLSSVPGVRGSISNFGITTPSIPIANGVLNPRPQHPAQPSDFWSKIWR